MPTTIHLKPKGVRKKQKVFEAICSENSVKSSTFYSGTRQRGISLLRRWLLLDHNSDWSMGALYHYHIKYTSRRASQRLSKHHMCHFVSLKAKFTMSEYVDLWIYMSSVVS